MKCTDTQSTEARLARALELLDECLNNWASLDFDSAAWDRRTKALLDECGVPQIAVTC